MEGIKNSIAGAVAIYVTYSAIAALTGSFEITHSYFNSILIVFILFPCTYLIYLKNSEINKIFAEREKFKIDNANSYPTTMCIDDISHGKNESRWSFWRQYLLNFLFGLAILGTAGVIFLYGLSAIIHEYVDSFSNYKAVKVVAVGMQCPHRTATIQVCDLMVKTQNGETLTLKAPTKTANNFISGQKYIIEYKYSFIGQSLSKYKPFKLDC